MKDERLIHLLPPGVQGSYEKIAPPELRLLFEKALNSVLRWKGSKPHNPDFIQTVLDHIECCIGWAILVKSRLPNLTAEVDIDQVIGMLMIHDVGEVLDGDMNKSDASYDTHAGHRKKRYQYLTAVLVAINHIADPQHRAFVQSVYSRFEGVSGKNRDGVFKSTLSDDREALFARLIDLMEGNWTAVAHFYSLTKLPSESVTETLIAKRLAIMLDETMVVYLQLRSLLSPEAQSDLDSWWDMQVGSYEAEGYDKDWFMPPFAQKQEEPVTT